MYPHVDTHITKTYKQEYSSWRKKPSAWSSFPGWRLEEKFTDRAHCSNMGQLGLGILNRMETYLWVVFVRLYTLQLGHLISNVLFPNEGISNLFFSVLPYSRDKCSDYICSCTIVCLPTGMRIARGKYSSCSLVTSSAQKQGLTTNICTQPDSKTDWI